MLVCLIHRKGSALYVSSGHHIAKAPCAIFSCDISLAMAGLGIAARAILQQRVLPADEGC